MKQSIVLCLLLVLCVGCNSSTTPSAPNAALHPGGVGSSFTYTFYDVDSVDGLLNVQEASMPILATGITYQGKTNVTQYQQVSGKMQFVNYEANGNLSIYHRNHWEEVPLATKGEIESDWYDTSSTDDIYRHKLTMTYAGMEDLTLAGQTFHATKIISLDHVWTNGVPDDYQPVGQPAWFASEFGWYVKVYEPATYRYGRWSYGTEILLKSYLLK